MKKSLITLAIAAAVAAPMTVSAAEAKFFGYSQITAQPALRCRPHPSGLQDQAGQCLGQAAGGFQQD